MWFTPSSTSSEFTPDPDNYRKPRDPGSHVELLRFRKTAFKLDDGSLASIQVSFHWHAAHRSSAVRNAAFRFLPYRNVSTEAFLDRLLKERMLGSAENPADSPAHAAVPTDKVEHFSLMLKVPDQPEDAKVLRVAIIGAPNSGKSTLTNQLLGKKLFAASQKVHTTRSRALGVITEDNTQIILLDTPGLTTPSKAKRHQLEKTFLVDPLKSLRQADLVVVLVDVSDKWTRGRLDFEVLKCLALNAGIPSVLVLNKVDLLKGKPLLLDITAELTEGVVNGKRLKVRSLVKPLQKDTSEKLLKKTSGLPNGEMQNPGNQLLTGLSGEQLRALKSRKGWSHFKDVFMMCATDGEDVQTLKSYLMAEAKPGPWQYHSAVLTDQSPEDICTNAIREKLLEYLPQEVPYSVTQHIELWRETADNQLDIAVKLHVRKDSHMKMVIGPGGQLIARIAREAGLDLTNAFMCEVRLKISATLKN
ncbi:GTPase Era, mitochondrial [Silurus asotus]|uniref:GTPase Era, mitochondrial n=1 Tax=Silurus asotus TaxID=30991 RepID=A0AAD5AFZ2_SILAS|nr:GTPase Era, mitochondrial [Silurus asotus]